MTLQKAKRTLAGKIEFDNPKHIEAARYLKRVAELADRIEACEECDGTGRREYYLRTPEYGTYCPYCLQYADDWDMADDAIVLVRERSTSPAQA